MPATETAARDEWLQWPFFDENHRAFAEEVRQFAEGMGESEEAANWAPALGSAGLLRACVPGAYGGRTARLDVRSLCIAREILAKSHALADFAFAMQGLGAGPVTLFGTAEQQQRYLPAVGRGTASAAFALSEEAAGSDVAAIETRAQRDGDAYVLTGEKMWISNAGLAAFYVVFARTADTGAKGLSAFIVDADTPGFQVTRRIDTISPHPLGALQFDSCRIPSGNRIGGEGEGFKIAMATLDVFRSTVGAAANGFAARAMDAAVKHVTGRHLFGQRLADMQLTQAKIASMATGLDASRLLVYRAAYAKDAGAARITREAAMAKWHATETASRIADDAVQLFGGQGVVRENVAERAYRDIRALRIYEGASEIQQIVIARSVLEAK